MRDHQVVPHLMIPSVKMIHKIRKGPSSREPKEEGYIYCYSLHDESSLNFFKIGVAKDPFKRVRQWKKVHGDRILVLHFVQLVAKYAAFCEKLVHLYFEDVQLIRFPSQDGKSYVKTVKKLDGTVLQEDKEQDKRPAAVTKQLEWFHIEDLDSLKKKVKYLAEYCGNL